MARTAYYPDGWHLLDRDLHADIVLEDAVSFIHDPAGALAFRRSNHSQAERMTGAAAIGGCAGGGERVTSRAFILLSDLP